METTKKQTTLWLWLTIPLAILLGVATFAGVFNPDTYAKDAEYFATQGIAQDFISLFVTIPVLIVSFIYALRGSMRARLIWLGMLGYTLYSYILYAFFVNFNSLFLVYSATLALSLYAFVGAITTTDQKAYMEAVLANRKNPARFKHRTAIILFVVSALFYMMWLSEVTPALLGGYTPQSVIDNGLPSNPVHVLDLSFLLPGLIITGILILKNKPLGFVLAPAFFAYGAMLGLAIIAMIIMEVQAGYPLEIPPTVIFTLMTVSMTVLIINYTKGLGLKKS
jgi:hypothetical protein